MRDSLFVRRGWFFAVFILGLFNFQAFAQIGLVVQLPPNANVETIAEHANGAVVDVLVEANQILLSVPAVPKNLTSNEVRWMELNQGTTLPSSPHPAHFSVSHKRDADWYKTQPALLLINLAGALTYSTGRGVVVADINSEVDYSHPALIGHLTTGHDFVSSKPVGVSALNDSSASYLDDSSSSYLDAATVAYLNDSSASYLDDSSASYLDSRNPAYSHGTLTAGIIAAVAPDAMIMPLRAFDDNGSSSTFMIARAIRYAVDHGAQVINMSFGTLADTSVLQSAIEYATSRNVTLVASAGNYNTSNPQFPAAYPGVITIAATDLSDVKAAFSNYGSDIEIDAPGVNVIAPVPGNLYALVNGTSFSAPMVAGAAALLRSAGVTDAGSKLAAGAINIDGKNPGYAGQLGYGRVNILRSFSSN
jgi:subtilisin family serine protease